MGLPKLRRGLPGDAQRLPTAFKLQWTGTPGADLAAVVWRNSEWMVRARGVRANFNLKPIGPGREGRGEQKLGLPKLRAGLPQ